MTAGFDGLGVHLGNLSRLSTAQTRSISAENPTGEKGQGGRAVEGYGASHARDLGPGWKISPAIDLPAGETVTIADIDGPGAIQHIWLTVNEIAWRTTIMRFYWDDEPTPSIEVPLGDFFCCGWGEHAQINSIPVAVNVRGGFNSYWEMPFRRSARITVENTSEQSIPGFFYQITYALTDIPDDRAYLHCQWRRSNPLATGDVHTILDGVRGRGQYVGTYLAWGQNTGRWWGEGEVKFYLDGDRHHPTICGTGTEDYFGGAWCFDDGTGHYQTYSTPYLGLPQILGAGPGGPYPRSMRLRYGMYRWHVADPIRFQADLRITLQGLGMRTPARFHQVQDDIASTAWWYQTEPHQPFPEPPVYDAMEVI